MYYHRLSLKTDFLKQKENNSHTSFLIYIYMYIYIYIYISRPSHLKNTQIGLEKSLDNCI